MISRRNGKIKMPAGARIIHVAHSAQMLNDQIGIWAECPGDDNQPFIEEEEREFRMFASGEFIGDDWQHVGSGAMAVEVGNAIWHVYEKPRG